MACRRKKVRCPSERPACGYCLRLGQECQYASDTAAAGSKRTRGQSVGSVSAAPALANRTPAEQRNLNVATPQVTNDISLASTVSVLVPWVVDTRSDIYKSDLAARVAQLEAQLSAQSQSRARNGSITMADNFQDQEPMPPPLKRKLSANSQAVMQRPSISTLSDGNDNTSNDENW